MTGEGATQMPEGVVLLSGIVGSTAYGLAGPGSDVDRLGMFAAPTLDLLGLDPPRESRVTTHPDVTYHEAGKALCCGRTGGGSLYGRLYGRG